MMDLATFRAAFPAFAKTSGPTVQAKLDMAEARIGPLFAGLEDQAHGYLTAHLLASEPMGKDMRLVDEATANGYELEYLRLQRLAAGGPHGW